MFTFSGELLWQPCLKVLSKLSSCNQSKELFALDPSGHKVEQQENILLLIGLYTVQVNTVRNWSFRKSTHWLLSTAVMSPLLYLPEKQPPQWLLSFTTLSGSNHPSRVNPPLFKFCLQRRPRRKDQSQSALVCCSSAAGSSRDPAPFAPSPCGWQMRGSFSNQTW